MFYFPFHIWDVILPIDELHHFSRCLLHHQPDLLWDIMGILKTIRPHCDYPLLINYLINHPLVIAPPTRFTFIKTSLKTFGRPRPSRFGALFSCIKPTATCLTAVFQQEILGGSSHGSFLWDITPVIYMG